MKPQIYEIEKESKVFHYIPVYKSCETSIEKGYIDDYIEHWNSMPKYFSVIRITELEHTESTIHKDTNELIRICQKLIPNKTSQVILNNRIMDYLRYNTPNDMFHRGDYEYRIHIAYDDSNIDNLYVKYKLNHSYHLLYLNNVKSIIYNNLCIEFQVEKFKETILGKWEDVRFKNEPITNSPHYN